jgi:hypothetical protein
MAQTAGPDSHPVLLELRRTLAVTAGLLLAINLLTLETDNQDVLEQQFPEQQK